MATNAEIAARLMQIRKLMELAGESFYKYMAFEKAAASIESAAPLDDVIAAGELLALPGIGKSIAGVIEQLVATGTADLLDDLLARYPPTILDLLAVSGIGTKTVATLFESYGIASLDDLERAIADGRFEGAPRMGPKTIANWKRGLLAYRGRLRRTPLPEALAIAREAIAYLREGPPLERLTYAGSLRRQERSVGDIDLICTAADGAAAIAHFVAWERAAAIVAEGATKASLWLADGLQIDLRVLPDHLYGNLLQHFTGSREHNIKLREYAVRRNLRVSENGILNLETGDNLTCAHEADVYAALGMAYVPPELRSGLDEIELALAGTLPVLIEKDDLRGDFHMHTTWSDGDDSLEAMIAAAAARGYAYHAISDHSRSRGSFGLDRARLREQRAAIAALGNRYGIRTLCASEVDILPDGTLDFDDATLRELDFTIASVHTAYDQDRATMTARLIRACENPYVNLIGHPSGRGYAEYTFDLDAVFTAAARTGTALEIDGQKGRLDLPDPLARRAKACGAMLCVDSDSHRVGDVSDVEFALGQARRAGLTKDDVLNAQPLDAVLAFVAAKRGRAG